MRYHSNCYSGIAILLLWCMILVTLVTADHQHNGVSPAIKSLNRWQPSYDEQCQWSDAPTPPSSKQHNDNRDTAQAPLPPSVAIPASTATETPLPPPSIVTHNDTDNDSTQANDTTSASDGNGDNDELPSINATVGLPPYDQFVKQIRQFADRHVSSSSSSVASPSATKSTNDASAEEEVSAATSSTGMNDTLSVNATSTSSGVANHTSDRDDTQNGTIPTPSPIILTNESSIVNGSIGAINTTVNSSNNHSNNGSIGEFAKNTSVIANSTLLANSTSSVNNTTNTTANITVDPAIVTSTVTPSPSTAPPGRQPIIDDINLSDAPVGEPTTGRDQPPPAEDDHAVNYASFDAGAKLLAHSNGMRSASSMLSNDNDRYMMSPCAYRQWFVVALSEDIIMHSVVLSNKEHYSSGPRDFQVLGSIRHPTDKWMLLGQWRAADVNHKQVFRLRTPSHVRYLKFRLLTHYGEEYYCTLTYVRVYGHTVMQELHDELEQQRYEVETRRHAIKHAPSGATANVGHGNGGNGNGIPVIPIVSSTGTSPSSASISLPGLPQMASGSDDITVLPSLSNMPSLATSSSNGEPVGVSDRWRASLDAIADMANRQWPRARGTFIDPATNQPGFVETIPVESPPSVTIAEVSTTGHVNITECGARPYRSECQAAHTAAKLAADNAAAAATTAGLVTAADGAELRSLDHDRHATELLAEAVARAHSSYSTSWASDEAAMAAGSSRSGSIFKQLANRLKELEINAAVSERYLQELSLRALADLESCRARLHTQDERLAKLVTAAERNATLANDKMRGMESKLRNELADYNNELTQQMNDLYLTFTLLAMAMATCMMIGMAIFCCRSPPVAPPPSISSPSQPQSRASSPTHHTSIQRVWVRHDLPHNASNASFASTAATPTNAPLQQPSIPPPKRSGVCMRALRCCVRVPISLIYCIFCCSALGRTTTKNDHDNGHNNSNGRARSNSDHSDADSSRDSEVGSDTEIIPLSSSTRSVSLPTRSQSQQEISRHTGTGHRSHNGRSVIASVLARRRRSVEIDEPQSNSAAVTTISSSTTSASVSSRRSSNGISVAAAAASSSSKHDEPVSVPVSAVLGQRTKSTTRSHRSSGGRPRSVELDQRHVQQIMNGITHTNGNGTSSNGTTTADKRRSLPVPVPVTVGPMVLDHHDDTDDNDGDDGDTVPMMIPAGRPGVTPGVTLRPLKIARRSANSNTNSNSSSHNTNLTVDIRAANGNTSPRGSPNAPAGASTNWSGRSTTSKSRAKR